MSTLGRIGKGPHGFTSRDYSIDIPCERVTCPANRKHRFPASEIKATCLMPSAIKINAAGLCQTGQDLIDSEPKPQPKKPDGD